MRLDSLSRFFHHPIPKWTHPHTCTTRQPSLDLSLSRPHQTSWVLVQGDKQAPYHTVLQHVQYTPKPSLRWEKEVMRYIPGEEQGQGQEGGIQCRWTWSADPAPVGGPPANGPYNCSSWLHSAKPLPFIFMPYGQYNWSTWLHSAKPLLSVSMPYVYNCVCVCLRACLCVRVCAHAYACVWEVIWLCLDV